MRQPELRYEKWYRPILTELGTIRTVPENFYVASVYDDQLTFEGTEPHTSNIDQEYVAKWAIRNIFIPDCPKSETEVSHE